VGQEIAYAILKSRQTSISSRTDITSHNLYYVKLYAEQTTVTVVRLHKVVPEICINLFLPRSTKSSALTVRRHITEVLLRRRTPALTGAKLALRIYT